MHSRAARRGASPPSKDLLAAKAPEKEEKEYKPWLHGAQNAGIQKKQKKKQLTRAQKLRQQKGLDRAEADLDKLEKKVVESKKRAARIQNRAVDWEDLDHKVVAVSEMQQLQNKACKAKSEKAAKGGPADRDGDEVLPDLDHPLVTRSTEVSEALAAAPSTVDTGKLALTSTHAQTADNFEEII